MFNIDDATDAECRLEVAAMIRDRLLLTAAQNAGMLNPEHALPYGRNSDETPTAIVEDLKANAKNLFEDPSQRGRWEMSHERYSEIRKSNPESLGLTNEY